MASSDALAGREVLGRLATVAIVAVVLCIPILLMAGGSSQVARREPVRWQFLGANKDGLLLFMPRGDVTRPGTATEAHVLFLDRESSQALLLRAGMRFAREHGMGDLEMIFESEVPGGARPVLIRMDCQGQRWQQHEQRWQKVEALSEGSIIAQVLCGW